MLGCLIMSHMGRNTFGIPRDVTNKQHLLYKHTIPQLPDRHRFLFQISFNSGYIFRWILSHALPVPPEADCAPPSAWCWLSGHSEPAGACSGLFHPTPRCPDQLVELGSCRPPWTLIKYWCLAFWAGWLTKEELYEMEMERSSREDGWWFPRVACIRIKEITATHWVKIIYCISYRANIFEKRQYPTS